MKRSSTAKDPGRALSSACPALTLPDALGVVGGLECAARSAMVAIAQEPDRALQFEPS